MESICTVEEKLLLELAEGQRGTHFHTGTLSIWKFSIQRIFKISYCTIKLEILWSCIIYIWKKLGEFPQIDNNHKYLNIIIMNKLWSETFLLSVLKTKLKFNIMKINFDPTTLEERVSYLRYCLAFYSI